MRPVKVNDTDLLQGLLGVFRAKGYDGASLNELADSSGLKKASLYHRYPGGKKEIVLAVLDFVKQWLDENILKVLSNKSEKPEKRLDTAIENLRILYNGGEATCILRALSMDTGIELFGVELNNLLSSWMGSFQKLGIDFGFSEGDAKAKAVQVIIAVEGSLVVSKISKDTKIFDNELERIKKMYTTN